MRPAQGIYTERTSKGQKTLTHLGIHFVGNTTHFYPQFPPILSLHAGTLLHLCSEELSKYTARKDNCSCHLLHDRPTEDGRLSFPRSSDVASLRR